MARIRACFAKGSVDILDATWILALSEEGQVSTTLIAENMSAAFKGRRRLRPAMVGIIDSSEVSILSLPRTP